MDPIAETIRLALAHQRAGRLDEAEQMYRQVLASHSRHWQALHMIGLIEFQRGRHELAEQWLRRAIDENPSDAQCHANLGELFRGLGKPEAAEACYREALAIMPDMKDLNRDLGVVLESQGKTDEAMDCYRAALTQRPDDLQTLRKLGSALHVQGRFDEAMAIYEQMLRIQPDDATVQVNFAMCHINEGRLADAQALLEDFIRRNAGHAMLYLALGMTLHLQGRFVEATSAFESSLAIDPDFADSHLKLGLSQLVLGDFTRGWREFEWRLKTQFAPRAFPLPRWNGADLDGDSILVHAEFGLGDTMQFARYVPLVERRGGQVSLAVQPPLIRLMECSGFQNVVSLDSESVPACKWQVPLLSLPMIFGTTLESIPASVPYLHADRGLTVDWGRRLQAFAGFRIGIHWRGLQRERQDARSIPLAAFEPIAQLPGVRLISLQTTDESVELGSVEGRFSVVDFGGELDRAHGAFMDSAAIMRHLDLVITCDTSIAHLAGALVAKVWVALPLVAESRWLVGRADSPWYPTMRLYRQTAAGEWGDVFQRMAADVAALIAARPPRPA